MPFRTQFVVLALLSSPAFAMQVSSPAGASAQLQISQTTEAPGLSLSRGNYAIRVADRLQDRLIVQIQKSGSGSFTSLLGYPNPALRGGSFTGPVLFASGLKGKPTLRGYAFAGGPVVEFVFPKSDAVELAKANSVRVMAVDTASEGKVALPNLTQTDMSEVTLWMLTPTAVDPATAKPGIQAARYQVPASTGAQTSSPSVASVSGSEPSQPVYASPAQSSAPVTSPRPLKRPAPSASVQVASNHPPRPVRTIAKQLPHTATDLPLLSLVGLLSLLGASGLTLRRRTLSR